MKSKTSTCDTLHHLEIHPADALVDAPVSIRLSGFPAGQHVTLHAEMPNYLGCTWTSHATFVADQQGCVDVGMQCPVAGTYDRPDPMGLFWSMTPAAGAKPRGYTSASVAPLHVQFTAVVDGSTVASQWVERRLMATGVSQYEVRDDGLVATLYRPPGSGPRPMVISRRRFCRRPLGNPCCAIGVPRLCDADTGLFRHRTAAGRADRDSVGVFPHSNSLAEATGRDTAAVVSSAGIVSRRRTGSSLRGDLSGDSSSGGVCAERSAVDGHRRGRHSTGGSRTGMDLEWPTATLHVARDRRRRRRLGTSADCLVTWVCRRVAG